MPPCLPSTRNSTLSLTFAVAVTRTTTSCTASMTAELLTSNWMSTEGASASRKMCGALRHLERRILQIDTLQLKYRSLVCGRRRPAAPTAGVVSVIYVSLQINTPWS